MEKCLVECINAMREIGINTTIKFEKSNTYLEIVDEVNGLRCVKEVDESTVMNAGSMIGIIVKAMDAIKREIINSEKGKHKFLK